METKENYYCINCGSSLKFIFKEYSPSVLKLQECEVCHQIGDKYIEYDPVIVIIDIILLNKEAYRHILFNSPFKNNWKLAIVLLLIDSYAEWSILKNSDDFTKNQNYDIFQGERIFYFILFRSVLCILFFLLTILFLTSIQTIKNINSYQGHYTFLWKAFLLSSFGKFLRISEIIWGDINPNINRTFITGYSFLSQMQSYSVVCKTSRITSIFMLLTAFVVQTIVYNLINSFSFSSFL